MSKYCTLSPASTLKDSMTCSAVSLSVVSLVMNSMKDLKVTWPVPVGSTMARIRWNSASPLQKRINRSSTLEKVIKRNIYHVEKHTDEENLSSQPIANHENYMGSYPIFGTLVLVDTIPDECVGTQKSHNFSRVSISISEILEKVS